MNVKSAALWQSCSNITNMILGVLQLSILTRVFDASQFGLIALVLVVVNICQIFSDLGMSNYIIYSKENDKKLNSTIFFASLISGFIIFLIVISSSKFISLFYHKPELQYLLNLNGVNFIIMSTFMQVQACYIKFSRIERLAQSELISKIISFIITIFLAFHGYGIEVIIWGTLINFSLKSLFLYIWAEKDWLPGWCFSKQDFKLAWNYGIYQIGSQIINQLRMNLDIIVLGMYVNDSILGLYSLAKQLVSKPIAILNPIISRISLSVFGKTHQDKCKFKDVVQKYHSLNVSLITFVYVSMALYSSFIVALVYGEQNIEASSFFVPLALFWGIRYSIGALVGPLVQSSGKTKQDFIWNLICLGVFSIGMVFFAKYGAKVSAWSFVAIQLGLAFFVYKLFFRKLVNITISDFFIPIAKYYTISVGLVVIKNLLNLNVDNEFISFTTFSMVTFFIFFLVSSKELRNVINVSN